MRDRMKLQSGEVVIVGTDRGGVGKTMTAELVVTRMEAHGVVPVVIEVETEARLREVMGDDMVRTIRIGQHSPEDIERDPGLLYAIWEELGDAVLTARAPVVVDLGANLTRALATYLYEVGEDGPFGTGEQIWFLGVTGSDRFSLNSVNFGLSYMAQALPGCHRWLVINDQNPRFSVATDNPAIRTIVQNNGVEGVIRIPACSSPAFEAAVNNAMRLTAAAEREAEFWGAWGYGPSESRRAVRRFRRFLAESIEAMEPLFPRLPALVQA